MLSELIKLANELDRKGLRKEADYLDYIIKKAGVKIHFPVEKKHPNPKVVDLGNIKLDSPMPIYNVFGYIHEYAQPLGAAHFGVDKDKIKVKLPEAFYDVRFYGRAAALESTIIFTDAKGNSKSWSDPIWDRVVEKSSDRKYIGADGQSIDGLPYFASQEGLIVSVSGVKAKVWPKEETHPSWTDPNWMPVQGK